VSRHRPVQLAEGTADDRRGALGIFARNIGELLFGDAEKTRGGPVMTGTSGSRAALLNVSVKSIERARIVPDRAIAGGAGVTYRAASMNPPRDIVELDALAEDARPMAFATLADAFAAIVEHCRLASPPSGEVRPLNLAGRGVASALPDSVAHGRFDPARRWRAGIAPQRVRARRPHHGSPELA